MARYKRRADGYYQTSVWDGTYKDGKKHRKVLYAKTMEALNKAVDKNRMAVEYGFRSGAEAGPTGETFHEYAKRWLEECKSSRSANTYEQYRHAVGHMEGLTMPVARISFTAVQGHLDSLADRPRTQQVALMTLKQVVRRAERERILPRGASVEIFDGVATARYAPKERRPLTGAERECIRTADFTPRERAFVYLLYGTGIRREEALALTKSDIRGGSVNIDKAYAFAGGRGVLKGTKTARGKRTVPMPGYLAEELASYTASLDGGRLFTNADGGGMTPSGYQRMWGRIIRAMESAYLKAHPEPEDWADVGIRDLSAHIFRHNYCTMLCYEAVAGKISTKQIARLLGDTEAMVARVYSHVVEGREDTMGAVASALPL